MIWMVHPRDRSYPSHQVPPGCRIRDLLSQSVTDASHLNFRKRCPCQRLPRSGRSFRPPASPKPWPMPWGGYLAQPKLSWSSSVPLHSIKASS